ncbi:MAG: hypothetical protein LBS48_07070, partial [Treponema sp.]|nr:hypothetical protein [Treponema sp.]
ATSRLSPEAVPALAAPGALAFVDSIIFSSFHFALTFLYKESLLCIRTYNRKKILSSKFVKKAVFIKKIHE